MDALYLLTWRFAQGEAPPCMDAADADDNGEVWILTDSYTLLQYGFAFGPPPPDPGPFNCGIDPDAAEDELDCEDAGDCL